MKTTPNIVATAATPRTGIGVPTYLSPLSSTTPAMKGRTTLNVPRDEISDPTTTAGTLPRMIDAVTANSMCPKISDPAVAAIVSGIDWAMSVPTRRSLRIVG